MQCLVQAGRFPGRGFTKSPGVDVIDPRLEEHLGLTRKEINEQLSTQAGAEAQQ